MFYKSQHRKVYMQSHVSKLMMLMMYLRKTWSHLITTQFNPNGLEVLFLQPFQKPCHGAGTVSNTLGSLL